MLLSRDLDLFLLMGYIIRFGLLAGLCGLATLLGLVIFGAILGVDGLGLMLLLSIFVNDGFDGPAIDSAVLESFFSRFH